MDNLVFWSGILVAVIAAVTSVTATIINRRGGRDARREPTWDGLIARLSAVEDEVEEMKRLDSQKMGAVARIFKAIDKQWPTPDGPDIDPHDIKLIEDTIPPRWLRRPPSTRAVATQGRG